MDAAPNPPSPDQQAVDALRSYLRKLSEDGVDTYFNADTDFVDGRINLAEIVGVVKSALAPAPKRQDKPK